MKLGLDAVRHRISVRTYEGRALEAEEREGLLRALAESVPGPFGARPRFLLLERGLTSFGEGRIGTYGQIRGAPAFIIGAVEKGPHAMEDFGYALEGILLRATELGLGSCWLGGVFGRGVAAGALGKKPNELIPACSPVGMPAASAGLQDRLIRLGAGSRNRKDPRELFFELGSDGAWIAGSPEGAMADLLEAVRQAPSASNRQPWRLVYDRGANLLHLFLDEDRLYNSLLGEIKLQNVDMGIAMRHVELACVALGLKGTWELEALRPGGGSAEQRYIATWAFD